ncbi:fungal-specific transcription factor domain-containing protein [Aspergillus floccosus]
MDPPQPSQLNAAKRSIMRVNPQRNTTSRRHRSVLSCTPCRRRKVKCDRLKPCGQCVRSNAQDACTYPPPPTPSLSPPETISTTPIRSHSVRHTQNPGTTHHSSTIGAPTSLNTPYNATNRRSAVEGRGRLRDHPVLSSPLGAVDSHHAATPPRSSHGYQEYGKQQTPPLPADSFSQSLAPLSFRGKQQRTRFFGRSHWATTLGMFPDLNAHLHDYYRNKQRPTDPEFTEYLTLKRLKHDLRGPDRRWRSDHQPSINLKALVPGRRLAEYLMQLYFSTFENTLRILHVPSFVGEWNSFWDQRESQTDTTFSNDLFLAKLLALMACSGCLASGEPLQSAGLDQRSLIQTCHNWIEAVATRLALMTSHAQLSVDVIQIKCLLLLAQQATAWEGDLAGMASGSLIREAMLMGLHRDPANFAHLSPYWAEIRKRLWLTIIELEVQASLYGGIPLAISWDEFDCPFPSNIDDEDFSVDSPRLPPSKPPNILTRTSFQIALAQTLQTRMTISKTVNRVRLNVEYDYIMKLSERLSTELADAPTELRDTGRAGDSAEVDDSCPEFRRSFFLFLHYRCLLALHRPFFLKLAETLGEPYVFSRRVCVQTSLALLAQLEYSPGSLPSDQLINEANTCPHILQLKGGMFRDDIFHAATTICFEIRLQAKDRVVDPFPGIISGYMDQSAFYQRLALFQSVESAIRYFECKVRSEKRATKVFSILTMLFTAIKSQTLATEEGSHHLDGSSGESVLTIDDACPLASRRCRELLMEEGPNIPTTQAEGSGHGASQLGHTAVPIRGAHSGTALSSDVSHQNNPRSNMQPAVLEDAAGGDFRDLDLDWYFALDPLSPYPVNTWSGLDPLVI